MARPLTLALMAVFALAAPAHATTREYPASLLPRSFDEQPGPVLAGDEVVWADRAPDQSIRVVSARGADAPRTLLTHGPMYDRNYWTIDVSAAPGRVAVGSSPYYVQGIKDPSVGTTGTRVATGSPGGPLAPVFQCESSRGLIAVSERALLTETGQCERDGGIILRRLGPDGAVGAPERLDGRSGSAPRAAGRFVAWRYSTFTPGEPLVSQIVVWDLDASAEAYRVDASLVQRNWTLQADGKVAALLRPDPYGNTNCLIGWASQARPALQAAPSACAFEPIRMAGDRIAYRANNAIVLRELDAAETAIPLPRSLAGGFDFDGTRIAYGLAGCARDRVVVQGLGDPSPPASEPGPCRALLATRTLRIPTSRLISVPVTCPTGCRGKVSVSARRPCKTCRDGYAATPLIAGFVDVPPGGSTEITGRVPRRIMARFSCRSALDGDASLAVEQPGLRRGVPTGPSKRVRYVVDRQQGCSKRARSR